MGGHYVNSINIKPNEKAYVITAMSNGYNKSFFSLNYVCYWDEGYSSWFTFCEDFKNAYQFKSEEEARDFVKDYIKHFRVSQKGYISTSFKIHEVSLKEI